MSNENLVHVIPIIFYVWIDLAMILLVGSMVWDYNLDAKDRRDWPGRLTRLSVSSLGLLVIVLITLLAAYGVNEQINILHSL